MKHLGTYYFITKDYITSHVISLHLLAPVHHPVLLSQLLNKTPTPGSIIFPPDFQAQLAF